MALSPRRRRSPARVYVVLGDGELQKGRVWEAAMSAAGLRLGNRSADRGEPLVIGGLGAAMAEVLATSGIGTRFAMPGVQDVFAEGGSTDFLMTKHGLDADTVVAKARELAR